MLMPEGEAEAYYIPVKLFSPKPPPDTHELAIREAQRLDDAVNPEHDLRDADISLE